MEIVSRVVRLFVLCSALALALAPPAHCHPQHSSHAELGWSGDGARLEVSMSLIPEDLELALSARAGRSVVLEHLPDSHLEEKNFNIALLLESWLAEHFSVTNGADAPALPVLEGMDVSYKEAWLYFTIEASRDDTLELRNTVLLDVHPGQSNRVRRLWSPAGETLVFDQTRVRRSIWP